MNYVKLSGIAFVVLAALTSIFSLSSCADDETGIFDGFITFQADSLIPIDNRVYKLWFYDREFETYTYIADLQPDADGHVASTEFMNVDRSALDNATALAVSVDADMTLTAPAGPILMAGDFSGRVANPLSIAHSIAVGEPFKNGFGGEFDILSPSTLDPLDSLSGVWFYDTTRVDTALLNLPEINETWTYEAWIDFGNGNVLSMGRFRSGFQADSSSIYSGTETTLPFPGEDFVNTANLPADLTVPVEVGGNIVFITLEPSNDFDRANPFFIRPLFIEIPVGFEGPFGLSPEGRILPTGSGSR